FADFDSAKFTSLRVVNELRRNKKGDSWAYDLMPMRMGNGRHFGPKEECTQHDFWVTRANPKEINYTNLPKYVADGEPIMDADVVLWHSAPGHHEPRAEDGEFQTQDVPGKDGKTTPRKMFKGTTHVMWTGFDLRPRNIFDRTPLYPYEALQKVAKK